MARADAPALLEHALASVLVPALAEHGLVRFGSRNLGLVREGILQFANVQAAAFGPPRFCVNYAVLPLFRPHDFVSLSLGDRLRDARGEDAWWPADAPGVAATSMQVAARLLLQQAGPWFESTRTVAGLLAQIPAHTAGADPHDVFDRACCLARLGRLRESAHAAARARRLYLRDGRDAWRAPAEFCAMLFAAALAERVEALLGGWEDLTVRNLHLRRLVDGHA